MTLLHLSSVYISSFHWCLLHFSYYHTSWTKSNCAYVNCFYCLPCKIKIVLLSYYNKTTWVWNAVWQRIIWVYIISDCTAVNGLMSSQAKIYDINMYLLVYFIFYNHSAGIHPTATQVSSKQHHNVLWCHNGAYCDVIMYVIVLVIILVCYYYLEHVLPGNQSK